MDRLKEENQLLAEQLRIEKETGWKSVFKWKSKFEESQSQLKKELMLRDQQLKDIAASLLLLEDQLQENIIYCKLLPQDGYLFAKKRNDVLSNTFISPLSLFTRIHISPGSPRAG